ncbi:hypothetical protein LEMLEM_LOCUS1377, partial [Lemmus lemmus]
FAWGWSLCNRKLTFPRRVCKALWNTASLPFLFRSSSKIKSETILHLCFLIGRVTLLH